jgi:hypothetical protein
MSKIFHQIRLSVQVFNDESILYLFTIVSLHLTLFFYYLTYIRRIKNKIIILSLTDSPSFIFYLLEEKNHLSFFLLSVRVRQVDSGQKERIPHLSATLRYRILSGGSFDSQIFFLQLLLAVGLDRRPT